MILIYNVYGANDNKNVRQNRIGKFWQRQWVNVNAKLSYLISWE